MHPSASPELIASDSPAPYQSPDPSCSDAGAEVQWVKRSSGGWGVLEVKLCAISSQCGAALGMSHSHGHSHGWRELVLCKRQKCNVDNVTRLALLEELRAKQPHP